MPVDYSSRRNHVYHWYQQIKMLKSCLVLSMFPFRLVRDPAHNATPVIRNGHVTDTFLAGGILELRYHECQGWYYKA